MNWYDDPTGLAAKVTAAVGATATLVAAIVAVVTGAGAFAAVTAALGPFIVAALGVVAIFRARQDASKPSTVLRVRREGYEAGVQDLKRDLEALNQ